MRRGLHLLGALALAACASAPEPPLRPVDLSLQTRAISSAELFGPPRPFPPARSNAQIAEDILELGFRLESGREIPQFSRFEGPVRVRLTGQIPPLAFVEMDRMIARMRREAGIDISRTNGSAEVIVEFIPRAAMRRTVAGAACFVLPNVESFNEFVAAPLSPRLDWAQVVTRERALVVAPADATVQEMRDCLHEEVAQALGPLNDLYRIGETVMNDDNFQTALTGFDMLVLRVWYDPALRPGMSRDEVARLLPRILRRLNPGGAGQQQPLDPLPTPRAWTDAVEDALGQPGRRRSFDAARRALRIATDAGWQDERLAFSLFLAGRFAPASRGEDALTALVQAAAIYDNIPGGQVPRAHMEMHLAAQALAAGQDRLVIRLTDNAMEPARRSENGALLSTLMLLRAEAMARMGRPSTAARLRRESEAFAIFGFGSQRALEARQAEIGALTSRRDTGGG